MAARALTGRPASIGALALAGVLAAVLGCIPPRSGLGAECELNSECATPLVCRLGYCRVECATSEDCTVGLACVLDAQRIGCCQLPSERSCALASDCPAGLVCRFEQCTNACETDRDCPGGARCEQDGDVRACIDRSTTACNFDSDCDVLGSGGRPTRCVRSRCRAECFTDRDCRNGYWCDVSEGIGACLPLPRFARPDAGRDAVTVSSDDAWTMPGGCTTSPIAPRWSVTLPAVANAVATFALVDRRLVVIEPMDFTVGPGGDADVLDLDTQSWTGPFAFPEARLRLQWAAYGGEIAYTGGNYSTPGGDPVRDIVLFDPLSGTTRALGQSDGEPRVSGAAALCGSRFVWAGGVPLNATSTGSSLIDIRDLAGAPPVTGTLPYPLSNAAAVGSPTHVYLAGGIRDLMYGTDYATNLMFVVDCADGSVREVTMPHYYGPMRGAEVGGRLYFTGGRYGGDTTVLASADRYGDDTIEVFDPIGETWESITAPPGVGMPDEQLPALSVAGRFVRQAGAQLQIFDPTTRAWTCLPSMPGRIEGIVTDGSLLYVGRREGTTITVAAHSVE